MTDIDIFYADDDDDDMLFFNDAVEKITVGQQSKVSLYLHVNGESLIENLKRNKQRNGIVFLDINMPLKTGMELLSEIRNEPDICKFPVIMYSTSSNPANIEQCRDLGADLYVVKPSSFKDLETMLSRFIQIDWSQYQAGGHNFLYRG